MPRFRVPTDRGTFEVETDVEDPTEEELLQLVGGAAPEEEGPGLLRRGAATAARIGGPLVGGLLGSAAGPLGAAGGAAAGGAAGEAAAEYILGEEISAPEIALSAGLSAIPAGPFARAAARPGLTIMRRVALQGAEGAAQGVLAAEAESVVRKGELAGIPQLATGAVAGAALGGAIGAAVGRPGTVAERPLSEKLPIADTAAAVEAAGGRFKRVPGLAGEIPPRGPIPDTRLTELQDSVDTLFPHLGDVERRALKETIGEHGDALLEHSRSVQSVERTDALAQELVADFSRPLPKGTSLNAEQMRHVISLMAPLQDRVTSLAAEVASRPSDDVLKLKLQQASTQLANVVFSYAGARAEAGRTLHILGQQSKALMTGDAKAVLAARRMGIDADAIAKVIAASPDDPVAQYRQVRDMYRPDWKDKLKWYYYSNILSGPQTHLRNLVSNTVNVSLRPLTTPFAAAADTVTAAVTGREREVFLGEAPQAFLQMYRALPEAWNKAAYMFRNGFTQSDVSDFEVRPAEMPGGRITNLIGRGLASADEFFRGIGFSMELHAGAFARARKQALREGLSGSDLSERTATLTADLLDRKPQDLLEQAENFARRVTFQEQDNVVSQKLTGLVDAIQVKGVPIGRFLVPFVRTPANIFRQGVHFSPLGLLAKTPAGREGAQRRGEAVLGSALLMPVAWLAATENITGSAPTDPGERDAFYAEGKRPNSIRIGNNWVSYTELGPLILPFAVIANAADAWRRSGGGTFSLEQAGAIAGQVGRSTLEQSYLTSLSAVFQALEDPARYGQAFITNLAAGLIPAVGLQRNITRATDPLVREARTVSEGLQRNIPVLSEKLLPKLDALGQPVERVPTGPAALLVPIVSPARHEPIREELKRLGVQPDPLKRAKSITIGNEKRPLDAGSDFAIRAATGAFRALLLRELIDNESYRRGSTELQGKAVRNVLRRAGEVAQKRARGLLAAGQPVTFEALTSGIDEPETTLPAASAAPAPARSQQAALLLGPATALDDLFSSASSATGVDPTLLKAVAKVESNFNPRAEGSKTKYGTAIGPMQILPSTFRLFESAARRILGREPVITNPADNVLVGALYYRNLLAQTGGDVAAAARLYHGGPNLREHGPKTEAYGNKVSATYASYQRG